MAHTRPTAPGLKIVQRLITLADKYDKLIPDAKAKEAAGINPDYFKSTMNYYNKKFGDK